MSDTVQEYNRAIHDHFQSPYPEMHEPSKFEGLYVQRVGRDTVAEPLTQKVRRAMHAFVTVMDKAWNDPLLSAEGVASRKEYNKLGEVLNEFIDAYDASTRRIYELGDELRVVKDEVEYLRVKSHRAVVRLEGLDDEIVIQAVELARVRKEGNDFANNWHMAEDRVRSISRDAERIANAADKLAAEIKAQDAIIKDLREALAVFEADAKYQPPVVDNLPEDVKKNITERVLSGIDVLPASTRIVYRPPLGTLWDGKARGGAMLNNKWTVEVYKEDQDGGGSWHSLSGIDGIFFANTYADAVEHANQMNQKSQPGGSE